MTLMSGFITLHKKTPDKAFIPSTIIHEYLEVLEFFCLCHQNKLYDILLKYQLFFLSKKNGNKLVAILSPYK